MVWLVAATVTAMAAAIADANARAPLEAPNGPLRTALAERGAVDALYAASREPDSQHEDAGK